MLLELWEIFRWLGSILVVVLGAGWLYRKHRAKVGALRDGMALEKAKGELAALRVLRDERVKQAGERDDEVAALDRRIAEQKRKAVEAHEVSTGLSDDEIENAFRRLGF